MERNAAGHFDKETLLAYLDLELPAIEQDAIRDHLGACWNCRSQLAEIEQQVTEIATLVRNEPLQQRANLALAAFEVRRREFEKCQSQLMAGHGFRSPFRLAFAAAVAIVILAVGGLWWVSSRQPIMVPPSFALSRLQLEERATLPQKGSVRQLFRVEFNPLRPVEPKTGMRVELWSDFDSGANGVLSFVSGNVLRNASYSPDIRPLAHPSAQWELAESDLNIEVLEAQLIRWLQSRQAGPLLLVTEFLRLADDAGIAPQIQPSESGSPVRFTIQKTTRGVSLTVLLEVDPVSRRPLRQSFLLSTKQRAIEVSIHPGSWTREARVDKAMFMPPHAASPLPLPVPSRSKLAERLGDAPQVADRLPALEMEVRYALHRVDGFVLEPLQVSTAAGRIQIRGVVADADRRQTLTAALSRVDRHDLVDLALEIRPRRESQAVADPLAHRLSSTLHSHAWVLVQLAERYPESQVAKLDARSTWLLEALVRDLTADLERDSSRLSAHWRVVSPEPANQTPRDWRTHAFALYRLIAELDRSILSGGSRPPSLSELQELQSAASLVRQAVLAATSDIEHLQLVRTAAEGKQP